MSPHAARRLEHQLHQELDCQPCLLLRNCSYCLHGAAWSDEFDLKRATWLASGCGCAPTSWSRTGTCARCAGVGLPRPAEEVPQHLLLGAPPAQNLPHVAVCTHCQAAPGRTCGGCVGPLAPILLLPASSGAQPLLRAPFSLQVLASYRRMTWEWELLDHYVKDHMSWKVGGMQGEWQRKLPAQGPGARGQGKGSYSNKYAVRYPSCLAPDLHCTGAGHSNLMSLSAEPPAWLGTVLFTPFHTLPSPEGAPPD